MRGTRQEIVAKNPLAARRGRQGIGSDPAEFTATDLIDQIIPLGLL